MKSIKLSEEKVKYVALGDSISEGYNGKYGFGFAGRLDDKNITGTSWPSYLARYIQGFSSSYIESYENFSLSGTRIEDWNYFLGVDEKKYSYENSEEKIQFVSWLNDSKNNPERRKMRQLFNSFGKHNQDDFDVLISSIEEANLITMTIGANTLIPKIPIDKIAIWIIKDRKSQKQIKKEFTDIINSIEDDLMKLIARLKEINNKAHIYFIGYNQMQSPFWASLDAFFNKLKFSGSILEMCIDLLNNVIKRCAKKSKVNFISANNKQFIKEYNYELYNIFYEIHPTIFGYKKMAQDIFIKMALPPSYFKGKKILSKVKSFNENYLQEDCDSFKNCLDFSKTKFKPNDIIEKVFGKHDDLLFKVTKIEEGSKFLESPLFFEQSLDVKNDPSSLMRSSIKRALISLTNSDDPDFASAVEDISSLFESKFMYNFIFESKFFSVFANALQDKIDLHYSKNKTPLTNQMFYKMTINTVFDPKLVTWFLREFSAFWIENRGHEVNKSKKVFGAMISNLLKTKAMSNLLQNVCGNIITYLFMENFEVIDDEEKILDIINYIVSKTDFKKLSTIVLDFCFSSFQEFSELRNVEELIRLILSNYKIRIFIDETIKKITSSLVISKSTTKYLMSKLNIPNTRNNLSIMNTFFNNFVIFINKSKVSLDILLKFLRDMSISKDLTLSLQSFTDAIFDLEYQKFWNKVKGIKTVVISKRVFDNLVSAIDLIFSNMAFDGIVFQNLINLTNPSGLVYKSNKINYVNLISYLDRMSAFKKVLSNFFALTIENFYISASKTRDNIYYKTFFRSTFIIIFTLRQLFQKNISKNLFMNKKISIVNMVFQMAGFKNGRNVGIDNLMLSMFGEDGNYELKFENNKKKSILQFIFDFDKCKKSDPKKYAENIKAIFDLLKKG